ncbi:MAG: universal stress protein [Dehalococcoidales bacterium]|nr:MAG: universal stress protein [Dehalococcoidales bacterium]
MYQRMLVPLDGSELAEVVFTYAKELAGRLDLDIILLHVARQAAENTLPMRKAYIERAVEVIQRQSQEIQDKTAAKKEGKPIDVRGEVVIGYAADEILRFADENKVDLILMATHGRSGIKRWTMGSVADKILRVTKIPVWLVRAGMPDEIVYGQWPTTTILLPLDGSEQAESVLPHAETLAKQRGIEQVDVVLLRVCEPPSRPSYYLAEPGVTYAPLSEPEAIESHINWQKYIEGEMVKSKQVAGEYLEKVEKRFKDSNISVRSEILEGRAAEEIVEYANKNPFNLIVMSTHPRSGLRRLVYGSVTENVLQGVNRPVLLVRTD